MAVGHNDICSKCGRRNVVSFDVEPPEAFRTVVLNRWRIICPSCFDQEAEKAGVRYSFVNVSATPWSDLVPRSGRPRSKRR